MKKLTMLFMALVSIFILQGTAHAEETQGPKLVKEVITLTEDTVWEGDYYVTADVDLKGYTLTVTGNLILGNKTIYFHSGKLIVDGDFRIQDIKKTAKDIAYLELKEEDFQACHGVIRMDEAEDYLLVHGNFYPNGSKNILRNGTVELKGNFMYVNGSYMGAYDAIGEHKTIFSGDGDQRVYFVRSGSQFNILGARKTSGKMLFESTIDVAAIDEDTTIPVGGNGYLYLYPYKNKTVSLQGHKLTIDGTLFFERGTMSLDGGSLTVTKDLRIEKIRNLKDVINTDLSQLEDEDFVGCSGDTQLVMKSDKEKIMVEGSFIINNYKAFDKLRAGVIEVKKDVIQKGSRSMLKASGTHKFVLSGNEKQTVRFQNPSYKDNKTNKVITFNHFNILEIQNRYVYFKTDKKLVSYRSHYWYKKLIPLDLKVEYNGKTVKFEKYSPVITNGVIYLELGEVNKIFGIELVYNKKTDTISGKYGSTKLSLKATTINKKSYVPIEELLDKVKMEYDYNAETKTFSITK